MSLPTIPVPDCHAWARYYTSLDWHVVPLHHPVALGQCSCGSSSCNGSTGKHPNVGKDWPAKATTDTAAVEEYWKQQPNANVGVRLGPTSGVVDIEYDTEEGATTAAELGLDSCRTPTFTSQRSTHRIFQFPSHLSIPKAVVKHRGLEIRLGTDAKGSQSVFPPSVHASGVLYSWVEGLSPGDVSPQPLPESIVSLLAPEAVTPSAASVFCADHTLATHPGEPEGGRHPTFTSLVGRWIAENRPLDPAKMQELYALAHSWNERCQPPKEAAYVNQQVADLIQRDHAEQTRLLEVVQDAETPEEFSPFPLEQLPKPLNEIIPAAAKAIGCDSSFVTLPALSAISAVIGNSRKLAVKTTWVVPPLIWSAVVGDSGTRKSPGFDFAMRPLDQMEQEAARRHEAELEAYRVAELEYARNVNQWKRDGGTPPVKPVEPVLEELKTNDATTEALCDVLAGNPNGVLVSVDELAGWLDGMDRYSGRGGADRAKYLSMFNARAIKLNRKTGNKKTSIPNAAIAITGGIQSEILRRQFSGEALSSGLAARFILAWPPHPVRTWTEDDVPPHLIQSYHELLVKLRDKARQCRVDLQLSSAARQQYIDFYDQHNRQAVDTWGSLKAAWNKLEELPLRLGLCFQVITNPDSVEVSVDSMEKAIAVAEWAKHEANRVYAMLGDTDEVFEHHRVRQWMVERGGATVREVKRNLHQFKHVASSEVEAILASFCTREVDGQRVRFIPK